MRSTQRRDGAELTERDAHEPFPLLCIAALSGTALWPERAHAMHLSDGMLPAGACLSWAVLSLACVVIAFRRFDRARLRDPQLAPLMAMLGAGVFAISCMPVPVPWVGTCSHPCGTGLAAIVLGPLPTVLITAIALLLQALFLAHGGLTTLGADIASMGIAGGFTGYLVFHGLRRAGVGLAGAGFVAGMFSDWATYATTALELALGLRGAESFGGTFAAVALAFAPTQLPLGLLEGALTAGALTFLHRRRPALLARLQVLPARRESTASSP
ncbi:MAG: energy-coupling factor ABC transporter permease [Polyangiales bacterium]